MGNAIAISAGIVFVNLAVVGPPIGMGGSEYVLLLFGSFMVAVPGIINLIAKL